MQYGTPTHRVKTMLIETDQAPCLRSASTIKRNGLGKVRTVEVGKPSSRDMRRATERDYEG
jgi:hypothetical protein